MFVADPIVRRYLEGKRPYVIGYRDRSVEIPETWDAVPVRSFTSERSLAAAFETGAVDARARAILYDCEVWPFTPEAEQRDHAGATRRAAACVHARGLRFIAAPAVNLARLLPQPTARRYEDFLGAGYAADAARYADVFVVQAQGSERDVDRYARFVRAAARQARDANARVSVLAGISTNPGGQRVDANVVLRAIAATRDEVDGYWFNVPKPGPYAPRVQAFRPDIALAVFAALDAAGA